MNTCPILSRWCLYTLQPFCLLCVLVTGESERRVGPSDVEGSGSRFPGVVSSSFVVHPKQGFLVLSHKTLGSVFHQLIWDWQLRMSQFITSAEKHLPVCFWETVIPSHKPKTGALLEVKHLGTHTFIGNTPAKFSHWHHETPCVYAQWMFDCPWQSLSPGTSTPTGYVPCHLKTQRICPVPLRGCMIRGSKLSTWVIKSCVVTELSHKLPSLGYFGLLQVKGSYHYARHFWFCPSQANVLEFKTSLKSTQASWNLGWSVGMVLLKHSEAVLPLISVELNATADSWRCNKMN